MAATLCAGLSDLGIKKVTLTSTFAAACPAEKFAEPCLTGRVLPVQRFEMIKDKLEIKIRDTQPRSESVAHFLARLQQDTPLQDRSADKGPAIKDADEFWERLGL
jgi:hypothetical protein